MASDDILARIPAQQVSLSWADRMRMIARAAVGSMDVGPGTLGYTILSKINLGGLGLPPRRGTAQLLQSYTDMPWLRGVSSRVASEFAAVEWRLFYGKKRGADKAYRNRRAQKAAPEMRLKIRAEMAREGELQEIETHPLLDALDSANSYHTGVQMRRVTCVHFDLVGDAFWAKERNGLGAPTAFWPIPPSWILSTPSPQFPNFRVSYRGWQGLLPDTDVLWFQDTDPLNPYGRGTGLAHALGDELETDEYAAKTTKQVFHNRARPDILVAAEGLNKDEVDRLEQKWLEKNQGFFRGFKPYFLNRKVDVHEFEYDFRQLQFVQLRQFERDTIMQVFGIPPEIMGVIENSNRSTIDAADYLFTKKVVVPRLELFRSILQERLIPEYDDRLILDYESPVAEDKEFVQRAMAAMPSAYRVNEHRALTEHEELKGKEGEGFFVSSGFTYKEKLEEQDPLDLGLGGGSPFGGRPGTPGAPNGPNGSPSPSSKPEDEAPPEPKKAFRSGDRKVIKGAYEDAANRIADRLEPVMRAHFLEAVEAVRGEVDIEALARAIDRNDISAVNAALSVDDFATKLQFARATVRTAFEAGGTSATSLLADAGINLSFNMRSPTAAAWVLARGASMVTEITVETRQAVKSAIEDAFAYGRPPRETARALLSIIGLTERQTQAVDRFREDLVRQGVDDQLVDKRTAKYAAAQLKRRANNIARTEIAAAQNGGQQEAWAQARDKGLLDGEETRRIWIVTNDDRLDRHVCEPMDEQERGLDEPFITGEGEQVMQPPAHPQCRCTMGIVVRSVEPTQRIMDGLARVEAALNRPKTRTLVRREDGRVAGVEER